MRMATRNSSRGTQTGTLRNRAESNMKSITSSSIINHTNMTLDTEVKIKRPTARQNGGKTVKNVKVERNRDRRRWT